jgi:hypothetical protein
VVKKLTLAIIIAIVPIVMGASCEQARLKALDTTERFAVPTYMPWRITVDPSSGVTEAQLNRSVAQWNQWVSDFEPSTGREVFRQCEFGEGCNYRVSGVIVVDTGYTGARVWDWSPSDALGLFNGVISRGRIVRGVITLSSDVPFDNRVLEHEMGHALGLRNDPWSIDLNSLMSSPYIEGSEPTNADLSSIIEVIDARE